MSGGLAQEVWVKGVRYANEQTVDPKVNTRDPCHQPTDGARERGPRAVGERVHDREAQAGHRHDEDEQHRDPGRHARERTHVGPCNIGERAAAAPHRRPEPE